MSFDRERAMALASPMTWDLLAHWQKSHTWGNGIPFARMELGLEQGRGTAKVIVFNMGNATDSSHATLAEQKVIQTCTKRLETLFEMVIDAAPALDHPKAFWELEMKNIPHRAAALGEPEEPPLSHARPLHCWHSTCSFRK